jgi:hypothetical protein
MIALWRLSLFNYKKREMGRRLILLNRTGKSDGSGKNLVGGGKFWLATLPESVSRQEESGKPRDQKWPMTA